TFVADLGPAGGAWDPLRFYLLADGPWITAADSAPPPPVGGRGIRMADNPPGQALARTGAPPPPRNAPPRGAGPAHPPHPRAPARARDHAHGLLPGPPDRPRRGHAAPSGQRQGRCLLVPVRRDRRPTRVPVGHSLRRANRRRVSARSIDEPRPSLAPARPARV